MPYVLEGGPQDGRTVDELPAGYRAQGVTDAGAAPWGGPVPPPDGPTPAIWVEEDPARVEQTGNDPAE
ncbi:hypothetical protein [Microbacterium sp. NPDC096154]|uniref:hypothetical protein n=1 Tax=Microbacterium sp. NPDC096154 TaxID=3155549 RepID=UPI0033177360